MISGGTAPAFAQTPGGGPDPTKVRLRLGPLSLNPSISLTNLGVDNNVFNEPDDAPPKRDFTVTVSPLADLWLRLGPTWVTANVKDDIVWYQKYATERSGNSTYTVGWEVPLSRLTFKTSNTWLNTRERPGFEIDARAKRKDATLNGSVEIRALSKTFFGLRAQRTKTAFDAEALFLGASLREQLNRSVVSGGVTVRHQLTPLTTLTFEAVRSRDRFTFSPVRDSDSTSYTGGVNFEPAALISGSAAIGYRNFQPLSRDLPGYQGATAQVRLSYTVFGTTRFGVGAARDVQYSFDVDQPYYLQTGVDGSIVQQVFGPLDVIARLGTQTLHYRDRAGAVVQVANRIDYVHTYGGGVGYRIGRDVRIGLNVDQQKRTSSLARHQYSGLKIGTAVTYGS